MPAQQTTAAERRDDRVDAGQVLQQLEADRAIAADEQVVVEGMDEVPLHAIGSMLLDRAPAFVVGRLDDRRTVTLDRLQFERGRRIHHHDAALRAASLRAASATP